MSRELIWPPSLRISSVDRQIIGNAGDSRSPLSGVSTTVDRSGDRWGISVTIENLSDRASYAERANAKAFLAAIRNKNARVWIPEPGYSPRGSFSAPELFTNADFANGVTGWMAQNAALSVSDRIMRLTVSRSSGSSPGFAQIPTVTAFRPVVVRSFFGARSRPGATIGIYNALAGGVNNYLLNRQGMQALSFVPPTTSAGATYPVVYGGANGVVVTGDWIENPFTSMSHCALVDNAPNVLTQTNDFSHADWTKSETTVTANYFTAPDGTTSADRIIEDTSTGEHYVLQSKTRVNEAADWCFAIALAPGDVGGLRNRAQLRIIDSGSTNAISAQFDLLNGTISSAATAGGATANPRAFIKPMGLGYYYCAIVGQMPASDTTIRGVVNLIENPSTTSYTGASSRNIAAWRGTLAQSSVPVRLSDRTTAAPSGTSQTGSGLYLKGLPASASGLLLAGDAVQIGRQLFEVLAPLDSDAAGLGYLEVSPNIRTPFADNEPVIINRPMGRYMLTDDSAGYSTRAGKLSTMTLSFEEALD